MAGYKSNREAYRKDFRAEMARRVDAAAIRLAAEVRADISQPGTLRYTPGLKNAAADKRKTGDAWKRQKTVYNFTHSRPGNPPFKQKGNLRKSIGWERAAGTLVGRVGSNIRAPKYPLFLELGTKKMAARSYLRSNLAKHKVMLARIITRRIPAGGFGDVRSNQFRSGHFGRGARAAGWA